MIDIRLLRFSNAGPFPPPQDPPGPWTEYNFANSPAGNGFTELPDASAVVTLVTSGNPSSRRVEIAPNGGNKVFLTTDSPNLDPAVGVTGEIGVAVSSPSEYAGFEVRYLNGVVNWICSANLVEVNIPGGFPNADFTGTPVPSQVFDTSDDPPDNTAQTTFRLTINSNRDVRLYRNGALLFGTGSPTGTLLLPYLQRPSQTFMFWGEGG